MGKRIVRIMSVLAALILLVNAVPVNALTSDQIKEEIDELERENQHISEEMERLEQQLKDNLEQMEQMVVQKSAIDQQIMLLNGQVENINKQIRSYGALIADQQDMLDIAQKRLDDLNKKYKDRIRAMEEEREPSYWSVLFHSRDFTDFLDRLNMIREIAEADQRRLAELKTASNAVADAKYTLETQKCALEETREQLHGAKIALEQKRQEADALLQEMIAHEEEFQAL